MIGVDGHFTEIEAIGFFGEEHASDWGVIRVKNKEQDFALRLVLDVCWR